MIAATSHPIAQMPSNPVLWCPPPGSQAARRLTGINALARHGTVEISLEPTDCRVEAARPQLHVAIDVRGFAIAVPVVPAPLVPVDGRCQAGRRGRFRWRKRCVN